MIGNDEFEAALASHSMYSDSIGHQKHKHDILEPFDSLEDDEFLENVRLSRKYSNAQLKLLQVTSELNVKQSLVNSGELLDGALLEKRLSSLETFLENLQVIIDNKDRLVKQLRVKSHSNESRKLMFHHSHHKDLCKMFETMASLINNLDGHLNNLLAVRDIDGKDIAGDLMSKHLNFSSLMGSWFNSLDRLCRSLRLACEETTSTGNK